MVLLQNSYTEEISRLQLVKWLFLLKEEEAIDDYGVFYDFLPFHYGPFSFTLYKDLSDMEKNGFIQLDANTVSIKKTSVSGLKSGVLSSISRIIEEYGSLPQESLIEYVYDTFPWYASRSRLISHKQHVVPRAPISIYTIGYEGLSIDKILDTLLQKGIKRLIDVRNASFSRKYGFTASTLKERCNDVDIDYCHFPQIGIPSETRHKALDRLELWGIYKKTVLSNNSATIKNVWRLCSNEPSVLLCFEKNPYDCHRHLLARSISIIDLFPIIHYHTDTDTWQKEQRSLSQ